VSRIKAPLLVHLVFHPESDSARELAKQIHIALNRDPNVPGLRIPTVFCAEDGSDNPPENQRLDQAERSFVIPLADTDMDVDETWCSFVADLWHECQETPHRCLPIQLSAEAWPLDERLSGVNFVRAYGLSNVNNTSFVIRRIVTEMCRFLHGDPLVDKSPEAPTKLFISHTKIDVEEEPQVVNELREHLSHDQPIKVWFDSGDIPGGSRFAQEIAEGIEDSSLLCVRTNHYAGREWCRKEVLLAKEKSCPMVVINAVTTNELRSFPYLGNVPEVRWDGDPNKAIDLLLKETLRHLHSTLILQAWKEPNDKLFLSPPELLTLLNLPENTTVLYPDPPLGKEEIDTLEKHHIQVVTPLERLAKERPLNSQKIAISFCESTDIRRFGLDLIHFESATLELCRYLLLKGATLVYGGHLGAEGYTEKLMELVAEYNRMDNVDPVSRIENYIGWPIPFNKEIKARHKFQATLKRVARPECVDEILAPEFVENPNFFPATVSALHRYAWASGMTAMREEQTANTIARIIVGGTFGPVEKKQADGSTKESWYASRIPGVLEELVISLKQNQPVFIIGTFGGVASMVVDILEGHGREEMSWEYQKNAPHAIEMRSLYEDRHETWLDYDQMRQILLEKGVEGLNPGLTVDEHKELFYTTDIFRMVELVITGMNRLGDL